MEYFWNISDLFLHVERYRQLLCMRCCLSSLIWCF